MVNKITENNFRKNLKLIKQKEINKKIFRNSNNSKTKTFYINNNGGEKN